MRVPVRLCINTPFSRKQKRQRRWRRPKDVRTCESRRSELVSSPAPVVLRIVLIPIRSLTLLSYRCAYAHTDRSVTIGGIWSPNSPPPPQPARRGRDGRVVWMLVGAWDNFRLINFHRMHTGGRAQRRTGAHRTARTGDKSNSMPTMGSRKTLQCPRAHFSGHATVWYVRAL